MNDAGTPSKGMNIALWIVTVLLALAFLAAGVMKLVSPEQATEGFAKLGLPAWFVLVTGGIEIIGGALILVPRTAAAGALLIAATMASATLLSLIHGDAAHAPIPFVFCLMALFVAYGRRASLLSLVGRGTPARA